MYVFDNTIYRYIRFRGRSVSGKFVETIKKLILCSVTFFFPKNVRFVRYCGKNTVQPVGHRWQHGACNMRMRHVVICGLNERPSVLRCTVRTLPVFLQGLFIQHSPSTVSHVISLHVIHLPNVSFDPPLPINDQYAPFRSPYRILRRRRRPASRSQCLQSRVRFWGRISTWGASRPANSHNSPLMFLYPQVTGECRQP